VEASHTPARAQARAGADACQGSPGGGAPLSAQPETRARPGEAVAGLLASLSIFASAIGVAYRPGRMIPPALVLAFLATAIGGRHSRLAAFAIAIGGVCFVVGMAVAVITSNPIY
jgi:hypothetical protein